MKLDELRKQIKHTGVNPFYMSFSDLMMIICCFFVLLFSISKIEIGRFERLRTQFTGSTKNSLVELGNKLDQMAKNIPRVSISQDPDGIRINLKSAAFFKSGSAIMVEGALKPIIPILMEVLPTKYKINIEGHTDDEALYRLEDGLLETNWSLSGLRAATVVHELMAIGFSEERMKITGHASNRPKMSIKNKEGQELEKARAINRRVSILIH